MHKVIVERERHGSTQRNRKWGTRIAYVPDGDYDDQPKFASSARGRQYAYAQKRLSDVLGPLRGFLRSNIGRPWDKVFSELRQELDVRKVTGRHIFEHLEWMVETECSIGRDRKVYGYPRGYEVTGFYVHPRTQLLCFAPRPSARERKKARLMQQEVDELQIDDTRSFKRIGEQWFVVTYEVVEVGRYERPRPAWDVVQRKQVQLTWGRCCIAINKRHCNREEVRGIHKRIDRWRQYLRKM
jgi:hypothetical protein